MNYIKLIIAILICFFAGFVGTLFMDSLKKDGWYSKLKKSSLNPPNWVFPVAWSILYFLMGISLYIVWNTETKGNKEMTDFKNKAMMFFVIQLVLNSLWSIIFFGAKSPLLAFIEIILLLIFIGITIYYSYKVSKTATYLLIPYFIWVSFALSLNLSIIMLN